MCRLLAIVGTHPLPIKDTLEAFHPLGKIGNVKCTMKPGHEDGWGLSGFSNKRAVYFDRRAESVTGDKARFDAAGEKAIKSQSPFVIGHLRKASTGGKDLSNTHPFHSRDWIFAHNGTVFGATASFRLHDNAPQGETDSERLFLWMQEQIQNEPDRTEALARLLHKSRSELVYTSLNFLMTDGEQLWAYHDVGDKRYEAGETAEEREQYYTLYFAKVDRSAVICSQPLKSISSHWQPIPPRTLATFSPQMLAPRALTT